MRFTDTRSQMADDVVEIFHHAARAGNVILTGTEATAVTAELIRSIGQASGFYTFVQEHGEWVAIDRTWADPIGHGYVHVLDGLPGRRGQGGHAPRGITYVQAVPKDKTIGPLVTAAAFHLMTHLSEVHDPQTNVTLQRALGKFARHYGRGRRLVFVNGDANLHDDRVDVYAGSPITTCWDELGEYPVTHGHGTIDVIGSYDGDGRVRCLGARAFTDAQLPLHTDHNLIQATYQVREPRR